MTAKRGVIKNKIIVCGHEVKILFSRILKNAGEFDSDRETLTLRLCEKFDLLSMAEAAHHEISEAVAWYLGLCCERSYTERPDVYVMEHPEFDTFCREQLLADRQILGILENIIKDISTIIEKGGKS